MAPPLESHAGFSTAVMTSQEEPIQPTHRGYGTFAAQRQRRHSWHTRPCIGEAENFQVLVRDTNPFWSLLVGVARCALLTC